ncbi:NAC domain-containing protein 92-like [Panicum miliaceum]|uniref:NAC domain-containing protein 92-like n=1 Tax=Panicum miliaceum TaxID=4540 RepID=A0A3L6PTA4_PANMI|nr:NAC domain-containing protein 92-like [Panicum miliaceum]
MDEPGFRFHPTDHEIIGDYLPRKTADATFSCTAMGDIDLDKLEPWDLIGKAKLTKPGDVEWWFFTMRDQKRASRVTPKGYWKATGTDHQIVVNGKLAGVRKSLVFYLGRTPKGHKTNWIMHEYRLANTAAPQLPSSSKSQWAVTCLFHKEGNGLMAPAGGADACDPSASAHQPLPHVAGSAVLKPGTDDLDNEDAVGTAVMQAEEPLQPVPEDIGGGAVIDDLLQPVAADGVGPAVTDADLPLLMADDFFADKHVACADPHPFHDMDYICIDDFAPGDLIDQGFHWSW